MEQRRARTTGRPSSVRFGAGPGHFPDVSELVDDRDVRGFRPERRLHVAVPPKPGTVTDAGGEEWQDVARQAVADGDGICKVNVDAVKGSMLLDRLVVEAG